MKSGSITNKAQALQAFEPIRRWLQIQAAGQEHNHPANKLLGTVERLEAYCKANLPVAPIAPSKSAVTDDETEEGGRSHGDEE